ncbi:MAG: preprotein translocase subunit SecY [Mycoplasmoidaceae bacterium]
MNSNFFRESKKVFTSKKVWIGLVATLSLLIFFRFGALIAMPGVKVIEDSQIEGNTLLDIMNLLGGGGASQLSIFSVGISPYITAQIIIQLLSSDIIKPLSRLAKSGEKGRRKIEIINRILTVFFSLAQGYAILSLSISTGRFEIDGQTTLASLQWYTVLKMLVGFVAGSLISLFIADIITKKGIGNGISLLIMSGILSSLIPNFQNVFFVLVQTEGVSPNQVLLGYLSFIGYILLFIILLVGVVFIYNSIRKIPIQQIGQALTTSSEDLAYLPIKVNAAGVIPVIFASSIMSIPSTVAEFVSQDVSQVINDFFSLTSWSGLSLYVILILLFSFFYSYIQLNPEQISENFKKSGKYIPGIKAGLTTERYISRVLIRINCIGAPFLALIAAIPYILSITTGLPSGLAIGGTGIIIIVSGSLDFWQALCSAETNYSYSKSKKSIEQKYIDSQNEDDSSISHLW